MDISRQVSSILVTSSAIRRVFSARACLSILDFCSALVRVRAIIGLHFLLVTSFQISLGLDPSFRLPKMDAEALQCNICPKRARFSDVSHLLTHVSSKAHLSHYFKLQVRSHQEIEARNLLDEYDKWYKANHLAKLLSDRMASKEARKRKSLGNTRALATSLTARPGAGPADTPRAERRTQCKERKCFSCIRTIRVKGSHRTSVNRNLTSNPKTKVVPPRKSRRAGQ